MPEPSETIIIASEVLAVEIATLGAELQRLTGSGSRELLWGGDPTFWRGRAPILFPVIGMLAGGVYRSGDKTYAMPKHGFARISLFDVAERSDTAVTMRLAASKATRAMYPFEFTLDLKFALAAATLTVSATIANNGSGPMPASFGFHPAFHWPLPFGAGRADHWLYFANAEPAPVRRIDANGLLTPIAYPTPVEGNRLLLRDELFADDALIFDRLVSREVAYGAASGPRVTVDFEDFATLGVWTKPGAGFICIEPWQGFADPQGFAGDIRDKPGIIEIAPGGRRAFVMRIGIG